MGHSCERNVLDEQPAKMKAAEFLCFGCGGWRVVLRGSRLPSEGPHFSSLHRAISLPEPIKCFRSFLAAIHLLSISSDHRGAELSCSSTGATQMNVFLLHVRCVDVQSRVKWPVRSPVFNFLVHFASRIDGLEWF